MSKVFAIGLSKTGTTSLHMALKRLGYSSVHFPISMHEIDRHDAAVNLPVACRFEELDKLYPNSKFILTTRDIKKWLQSCEPQYEVAPQMEKSIPLEDLEKINSFFFNLRMKVFGTRYYDGDLFKKAYYEHLDRVNHYFTDRHQDLLVMNIPDGDGWNQLCNFLKHPVPQEPFPFENSSRKLVGNLNQDIAERLLATHPENWLS